MKLNLLKVVQNYLDYVDGFSVDSIFDSDESIQAANIAEHVYYTILDKNRDGIPTTTQIGTLEPSLDPDRPCVMEIPEEVTRIHDSVIRYNGRTVRYIPPSEFLRYMDGRTILHNTQSMIHRGIEFVIQNDKDPDFCTSFDDRELVFDSFDAAEDTTLQSSKSVVTFTGHPVFLIQDTFIIPLPTRMHSGYQDVVINECCEALRDIQKPSVARRANAFLAKLQQSQKSIGDRNITQKRYGRRPL